MHFTYCLKHKKRVSVQCGIKPENASTNCQPEHSACLFDLLNDPCEFHNLASELPDVVKKLSQRVEFYRKSIEH